MIFPEFARPPVAPDLPPDLHIDLERSEPLPPPQDPPLSPPQPSPQRTSWTEVAAKGNGKSKSRTSQQRAGSNTQGSSGSQAGPVISESAASKERFVVVRGCKVGTGLHDITRQISEGPLMSISIGRDLVHPGLIAGIIFLHAEHARSFLLRNKEFAKENGRDLFGAGVSVGPGPLWPEDDELRAMMGVTLLGRPRRRLIFSGAGLFRRVDGAAFRKDLTAICRDDNIELIWLYNQGNATVVFANTMSARAVLTELKNTALYGRRYMGVSISFATDPCEKALNLVTNVPGLAAVKLH